MHADGESIVAPPTSSAAPVETAAQGLIPDAKANGIGGTRAQNAPTEPAPTSGSTSPREITGASQGGGHFSAQQADVTAQAWLDAQCDMIAGVSRAIVFRQRTSQLGDAGQGPIAFWPRNANLVPLPLLEAAQNAARSQTAVIQSAPAGSESETPACIVAAPLSKRADEHVTVAMVLPDAIRRQRQALVQILRWGATWYALLCREKRVQVSSDRLVDVVEMLASSLERSEFDAAATTAVTELAARLSCTRVSLGLVHHNHVEVRAISNSSSFDARSNLVRNIGSAMDEAVDQNASVAFPPLPDGPPHVAFAQEVLARVKDGRSVCSTPLYDGTRPIGALTLERDDRETFDRSTIEICEVFGALLGPVLELKYHKEQWFGTKILEDIRDFLARLCGKRHVALKLYSLGLAALVMFFSVANTDYRITAQAVLEGSVKRVISAPRDGFVASADSRAGDLVHAGQVLATLDDRELRLERTKLDSQRAQFDKEQRAAITTHDRSKAAILNAQLEQVAAQIAMVDEQLARTRLTAPFEGIVVSGDLSQSLGSPVEHGQVLFEVAPLDTYRVILEVDERDIGDIAKEQRGHLTLTGLPNMKMAFTVSRIVPISTARDGRNFFEVEAVLDGSEAPLRPGMEGIGKIQVEERKLIWVWTHALVDWLRLALWKWFS